MRVIADTSFLMIPGMFGVDIVSEFERLLKRRCELVIPGPVVRELERISERGNPKERVAARVGLMLAKRGTITKAKGDADESISRLASKERCAVGTTDATLRRKLRRQGIPVIYLRQKSHLAVDGWI